MKTLYCIRHGYALHNYLYKVIGTEAFTDEQFRDTNLLETGIQQAKKLGETWSDIEKVELILVSPSIRTLNTARYIFKGKNIPMISLDFLLEYPLGEHICNRRRDIDDLKYMFPSINFEIKDNVLNWSEHKETIDELNFRVNELLKWIQQRPEKTIAIVGHSSSLGQFKNKLLETDGDELKHCHPYVVNIE